MVHWAYVLPNFKTYVWATILLVCALLPGLGSNSPNNGTGSWFCTVTTGSSRGTFPNGRSHASQRSAHGSLYIHRECTQHLCRKRFTSRKRFTRFTKYVSLLKRRTKRVIWSGTSLLLKCPPFQKQMLQHALSAFFHFFLGVLCGVKIDPCIASLFKNISIFRSYAD